MATTKPEPKKPAPAGVTDAPSLKKALENDGYKADVWYDDGIDQVFARVTKETVVTDEFSGRKTPKELARLLSVTPSEFKDPSFYAYFKSRLGI